MLIAIVSGLALVARPGSPALRDRRARWAGMLIAALASFATFKEGVVRTDPAHLTLLFANPCDPLARGRARRPAAAPGAGGGRRRLRDQPAGAAARPGNPFDVVTNIRTAWD